MADYSLSQIFLTFLIYAFLGWCLEVVFHIFKSKKFINRGFLQGPVCPIYGVGAVSVLLFLGHLEDNFLTIFIGGAIFASVLELATGYVLYQIFKTRWWDYSKKKYNIGGYISLDFSIYWGFASVFMMDYLHPLVNRLIKTIPDRWTDPVALFFFLIFSLDLFRTVQSLVSFRSILTEIASMRDELDEKLEEKKILMGQSLRNKKGLLIKDLEKSTDQWEEEMEDYNRKRMKKLRIINTRLDKRHRQFLKRYPAISSEEIRDKLKKIRLTNIKK